MQAILKNIPIPSRGRIAFFLFSTVPVVLYITVHHIEFFNEASKLKSFFFFISLPSIISAMMYYFSYRTQNKIFACTPLVLHTILLLLFKSMYLHFMLFLPIFGIQLLIAGLADSQSSDS